MKKILVLSILAGMFALTACGGGSNYGKAIEKSEFDSRVAEFNPGAHAMDLIKIETKGHAKTDIPGQEMDIDLGCTLTPDKEPTTESERAAASLIASVDIAYVENIAKQFDEKGITRQYFVSENEAVSIVIRGELTQSVYGVSVSLKYEGDYTWNKFGMLTHGHEKIEETASSGGETMSATSLVDFDATYTFKA